jgi:MtN3 and saliva related transmembrane protein
MSVTDFFGYAAGFTTALMFLPQVIKTWKDKSAGDLSLMMFLIAAGNELLWIVYGIMLDNIIIILTNLVVLSMSSIMILLKLRYKNATHPNNNL